MITNQIIQTAIEELKSITRVDLCILDIDGKVIAATNEIGELLAEPVRLFIQSPAESQVLHEYHFFKILVENELEYVLLARGTSDDVYIIGRVAVSEMKHLTVAYKAQVDRNSFVQNLLLGNLLLVDIYNRAKKLRIEDDVRRGVFAIEVNQKDGYAMETLKGIFGAEHRDFITAVDEKSIVYIKELQENQGYEYLESIAHMLVDTINTEAMIRVKISYGTIAKCLKDITKSYQEAMMALEVGKIFYVEKYIIGYNTLGIGRLIHQLPMPLCEMFVKEVFGLEVPSIFDDETLSTINVFFENNLNVSETARQLYIHRNTLVYRLEKIQKITGLDIRVFEDALTFRIVLMVMSHMQYMEGKEKL